MKIFASLLMILFLISGIQSGFGYSEKSVRVLDTEIQFVILEFPKFDREKIQNLIVELNTYGGKIADVQFNESTHQLKIQYYHTLKLDDIFEIVSKYEMPFTKLEGSELE